jgi:multiple sugar transport system substrate-binding protein
MKKLLLGAAMTGMLIQPALAQQSSDITATLSILSWTNDQFIASVDKATARFQERYPNVTIESQYTPVKTWGDYNNSFINRAATGDIPDIFSVAIEGFAQSAATGLLRDLESIINNDPDAQAVMSDIEPNLLDGMRTRSNGEMNFFPTEWNNIVVYYNKDMFDEAGVAYPSDDWTWDEFRDVANALTVRDSDGEVTRFGYFVPGFNFGVAPWFYTNGTGVLDRDWREPTVTMPEFAETLEYLHGLINDDHSAPAFEAGVGDGKFASGQVAMFSAGHWVVPGIVESGLTNVGVAMMPRNKADATVFGIGGLSITQASEHPELAWEFIKELTGSVFQQELADSGQSIPSSRSVATSAEWVAFPDNSEIFYGSAATAIPIAAPANFAAVEEIFMRHLESYLNENQDLDTTVDEMDRELQRAMSRVNK